MKIILLLFVVTFVNFAACTTPPKPKCPPNEHFETQSIRCQITCATMALEPYMGPCYPSDSCYCNGNKVRNAERICIDRSECPNGPPGNKTCCGAHEHYTECTNPCKAPKGTRCLIKCIAGCICDEGYTKKNGTCVPIAPPKCGKNEEYDKCGTACPDTCANYKDTCKVCTQQCVPGCFCKNGFVRDLKGNCIKPKKCPKPVCDKPNELFVDCPPNCPKGDRCNLMWSKFDCTNASKCCTASCRCKPGFYRNNDDICVNATQCQSTGQCADHAHYNECINCPPHAECLVACKGGCECDKGYKADKNKVCLKTPTSPECGEHAHLDKCPPRHCPPGKACTTVCIPACVCDAGYKFDDKHVCVKDQRQCGKNEHYDSCVNRCPKLPKGVQCKVVCKGACVCNEGYNKDDLGNCVKDIPPPKCGKNEEFNQCGSACPDTCDNYKNTCRVCTKQCVPGCFCKKGLVRDGNGDCIDPKTCPKIVCNKPHEHYDEFATNCPAGDGCNLLWSKFNCTGVPKCYTPACRCDPGYFRNNKKICVTAEQCQSEGQCADNSHYNNCTNPCPPHKICSIPCIGDCECNKGYEKDENELCVKKQPCDPDKCDQNSYYYDCEECYDDEPCEPCCVCNDGYEWDGYSGGCKLKCGENSHIDECPPVNCKPGMACPQVCRPACVCDEGYKFNEDGICVIVDDHQCPNNEEYKECGTACPKTCKNKNIKINCIAVCKSGCFCKGDLVRNDDGVCVPPSQCHNQCPKNEEYNECGTACPKTCKNKDIQINCIAVCKSGCFCKGDLVRNDDGACVSPSQCPTPPCPTNQTYAPCVVNCPTDFCLESNGPVPQCSPPYPCPPGCRCKPGYLKNNRDDQQCILKEDCPPPVICGKDEHYSQCGTACPATCDNPSPKVCTKQCVRGCFCNDDLVRNKDGNCVPKDQCPLKCGKNEVATDCFFSCQGDYCKIPGEPIYLCKPAPCPPYRPGCRCREGYKRNNKTEEKCIPENECPNTCPKNEHWDTCGSSCPATCNDPNPEVCDDLCNDGCYCDEGLVRNEEDGLCVTLDECPCKENEGTEQ